MKHLFTFLAMLLIAQMPLNLFAQNLSEDFEAETFPPLGWTVINKGDPNGWERTTNSALLINGEASARISYSSTAHNDWLITPRIMPTEGNATLSFYAKNYNNFEDLFNVKLSTTGTAEEDFSVLLAENIKAPTTATKYEYDLSTYKGQNIYVAIQAISTDRYHLSLDDFAGPAVSTPGLDAAILSIDNSTEFIGPHDIVLTLINRGTTDLTACNISYSVNGGTASVYNWTGSLTQDATEQVTIAVGYDFPAVGDYVIETTVALEGDEIALNDTQAKTVNYYGSEALPFFEGFEDGHTDGDVLANWWQESLDGSNSWTANSSETTYNRTPRTGDWNAYLLRYNTDWMFSPKPMYFETGKSYAFSMYARQDEMSGAKISVAYGTDKNSGAMLNSIVAASEITNGHYQQVTAKFTPSASGYYYMGIKGQLNDTPSYLSIDDISIKELSSVDAQVRAITYPKASIWTTGLDDIKVKLCNQGLNDLNAAQIQWSVDGTPQTPYEWTGTLSYGESEEITIGTFDFSSEKAYEISATVVIANDGDATNNTALLTTTVTEPLALPFFEGFEEGNTSGGTITTWTQQSLSGSSGWTARENETAYNRTPRTGEWNATLYKGNTDWMFSPKAVYFEAGKNYVYSMYARQDEMSGAKISVAYGTDKNIGAMLNSIVDASEVGNGDYQEVTAKFTPSESGYYYMGIKGQLNSTPFHLSIDDISIKELSEIDAQVTAITSPKASIWTTGVDDIKVNLRNQGLNDLSAAQIQWSVDGAPQTAYEWTGTLAYGESEEITIGTFDFSTEAAYEITATVVTANDGDATNNTALLTTTFTEPLALPFFEGFEEGNINNSTITTWSQQSLSGSESWWANKTYTSYNRTPRTGEWNATLYSKNTDWMFSPKAIHLQADKNYSFSMYARQSITSGASISVAYGAEAKDRAMLNSIVAAIDVIDGDYQKITATFTPAISGYYYIGIKGQHNYSWKYISIDDIALYSGYVLNYAAGTNGAITGETSQIVEAGANGTAVTAVANDGYHFAQWSDGVTDNPRTDVDVNADIAVEAEFALNTYTIEVSAGANGEISPATSQTVEHGSDVSFTITPNAGFFIASVVVDGVSAGLVTDYSFNAISSDHSISATFTDTEPTTHVVTASAVGNGSISPSGEVMVAENENITFSIAANPGYAIKDVLVDGTSVGSVSNYTFENITAAHTIVAEFGVFNALHFDGANDYVSFPALPTSIDLSQGFSFAAWVKWDEFTGNARVMEIGNGANGHSNDILIRTEQSTGELWVEVANNSANYQMATDGEVVTTNAWHHVALTLNGNQATLYIDGAMVKSGTLTTPRNVERANVNLGKSKWTSDKYFKGSMDEVSFWNKALTKNDIVSMMKDELAGTETGLIGYYSFNQGIAGGDNSGEASLNDASALNRNGTLNSFALMGATSNWVMGYESPVQFITVNTVANGTIIATPNEGIVAGSVISLTAAPQTGYELVANSLRAYKTGDQSVTLIIDEDSEGQQTFVMPAYDVTVTAQFEALPQTLTVATVDNGSITASPSTDIVTGTEITLTVTPSVGYQLKDGSLNAYKTDNQSVSIPIIDNKFFMPAYGATVTAEFEVIKYNFTYTAGANGSITGEATQTVNHGSDGTAVTAVPNDGYHFVKWSDDVTANPRTDANVTGDVTVEAEFAINIYTLTYTAGANGTITGEVSQTVNHGSDGTTITAVADINYHFVKWSDGSTNNPRTDANVTGDVAVEAEFAINTYTLTYIADANGTITGEATQTVNHGSDGTTVTAVANDGYHFVKWSDDVTANPRTDANVTGDVTVEAEFAINTYILTYTADANGTITGEATQTVNHGANGTEVEAVPATGYHFVKWSDGVETAKRTETSVIADKTVEAQFAINTYTLTYTADAAQGSITGNATQTVNHGAKGSEVEAIPTTGYHFVKWSDGVKIAKRTETSVIADLSVTAEFAINTYTLTYTTDATQGLITGNATQTVNHGANGSEVEAVPATGYHFVQWSDGLTTNPRTDVNVIAAKTVEAQFAINTYILTYTAGANGSLTGETTQTVGEGADGSPVTAVANAGYHFVKWSDGLTANPRTDVNVIADLTVEAEFAISTYILTYTAGANGSLTGETTQTVGEGADGTPVTAVANAGYHFVKWSDNVTANPRADVNVTADITVTAEFVHDETTVTYTLTYTAGANGTLTGETTQTVEEGADGTPVAAVANSGYHFVKWSDGSNANPRTDVNVMADIIVAAEFAADEEPAIYTLTFELVGANEMPIDGAIITIYENDLTSNGEGKAEIRLANGNYPYTISLDGYEALSDETTISGEDKTVKINMVKLGFDDNQLSNINVYPNPFSNRLVVSNAGNVSRIVVTNLIGQRMQVLTQENANSEWVISTSSLKSGIYLVTLYTADGKRVVRKVVKE